mgnify:CR=1 FL=1
MDPLISRQFHSESRMQDVNASVSRIVRDAVTHRYQPVPGCFFVAESSNTLENLVTTIFEKIAILLENLLEIHM